MGASGAQNCRKQPLPWAEGPRDEVGVIRPCSWAPPSLWIGHCLAVLASEDLRSTPWSWGPDLWAGIPEKVPWGWFWGWWKKWGFPCCYSSTQTRTTSRPVSFLQPSSLPPVPPLADPNWEQLAKEICNGWSPQPRITTENWSVDLELGDKSFAIDILPSPCFRHQDRGQEERDKAHEGVTQTLPFTFCFSAPGPVGTPTREGTGK